MPDRALLLIAGLALVGGAGGLYAFTHAGASPSPLASATVASALVPARPRPARPAPASRVQAAPTRPVSDVLAALRATSDPAARRALVDELARYPDAAARLRSVFFDEADRSVREEALTTAAQVGDPEAVAFLVEVASEDEAQGARAGAALGAVSDPRAAGTLAELASGTGPVIVRANAARALGASGGAEQAQALAELVGDPRAPLRVRQEAALALGAIGEPAVVPALAAALEAAASEGDASQLRISIIQGLGAIGTAPAREALTRHAARALPEPERVFLQQALR